MAGPVSDPYLNITDFDGRLMLPETDPLVEKCRSALRAREERSSLLPPLRIDPLLPLPLADAALPTPAVRFVFFIMASRSYAHETINRNVHALQRKGALNEPGTNESNLFLIHVDAKMKSADRATLLANVRERPDIYHMRNPRHVMWAGFSMVSTLFDAMASIVSRKLVFEMFINLSDADLTLRTDGELRQFFGRYPGRSIMSIVPRNRDPRRYKLHESFRRFCWTECEDGTGWVVATPDGQQLDARTVLGKKKCCWSRSAPIVYTRYRVKCPTANLPEVFHGSQWASLHWSLVHQLVRHPTAQSVLGAMEHTLLPDEAMLQTAAVNSPLRKTLIAQHMRFIEWPQLHGDANKYWASLGPQFHGGPMVLNETLTVHKAFLTSAMFARKFDPTIYADVLPIWDTWMLSKLATDGPGPRQPEIGSASYHNDPRLEANIPTATAHESDALAVDARGLGQPGVRYSRSSSIELGAFVGGGLHIPHSHIPHSLHAHAHGDEDEDGDGGEGHGHAHEAAPSVVGAFVLVWVFGLVGAGTLFACVTAARAVECSPFVLARLVGILHPKTANDVKKV